MTLQWNLCTNPAPQVGFTTSWTLVGVVDSTGANLSVTPSPEGVVSCGQPQYLGVDASDDTHAFSVNITAQTINGLATVTATEDGNDSVSAPVAVGEILLYDEKGNLKTFQSQHLTLVDTTSLPNTFPSFDSMNQDGLAYATLNDASSYVLNWGTLNSYLTDENKNIFQFFTSGDADGTTILDFPNLLWGYDPQGNLWQALDNWGNSNLSEVPPPEVPPPEDMSNPGITIAWIPELTILEDRVNPNVIVNVTCYLLAWGEAEKVRNSDTEVPVLLPTRHVTLPD